MGWTLALDPKTMADPAKIRAYLVNAKKQNRPDLVLQCQLRLAELAGLPFEDVLEREFWMAVTAAEELKTEENGKTIRLSRTRQKYARVGARKVIEDLAASPKITDGFRILADNDRPDLTFEGVVLRHHGRFDDLVVAAARQKLLNNGISESTIGNWLNHEG